MIAEKKYNMATDNLKQKAVSRMLWSVYSDEWVMHCKNKSIVIHYEDRATIVGAIRYVDEVVKNESRSKMEA